MSVSDAVDKLERRVDQLEAEEARQRERAETAEADAEGYERMWSRAQEQLDRLDSDQAPAHAKSFLPDMKRMDAGDWTRAMSSCVCDVCGFQFWQHATVPGFMWVHRICDGRLVKL